MAKVLKARDEHIGHALGVQDVFYRKVMYLICLDGQIMHFSRYRSLIFISYCQRSLTKDYELSTNSSDSTRTMHSTLTISLCEWQTVFW